MSAPTAVCPKCGETVKAKWCAGSLGFIHGEITVFPPTPEHWEFICECRYNWPGPDLEPAK